MSVTPSQIKSILITKDTANAPSEGTPRQVTCGTITKGVGGLPDTVVLAGLTGLTDVPWGILECLDGDCKGQKLLVLAWNDSTDACVVTPFRTAAPTTTTVLFRHWGWPRATATSDGSATTLISTLRTEADDTFNDRQMLIAYGSSTDLEEITDFVNSTHTFTVATLDATTKSGDAGMPVQCLSPIGSKIVIDAGKAIEREVMSDQPSAEGVVVGAQENITLTITPEVKGLAVAAAAGTKATAPNELREALQAHFTESLGTGEAAASGSTTTKVCVATGGNFAINTLAMVNGDAFGITVINTTPTPDEMTTLSGHLRAAPAATDVIYGGANYYPKTSGHSACSFLSWTDRKELYALTGAMAKWGIKLDRNTIAKYELEWHGIEGLRATWAQPHFDRYDTATPLVGRSNVSRLVLDGAEVAAELLSAEFSLMEAPILPGAAFGAVENKGGGVYGRQIPSVKLVLWMEDATFWNKYRKGSEMDFLLQVGRVPTQAWAIWGQRTQIVAPPEEGEADNLVNVTVTLRFLRPTTQGAPAYTIAHF